MKKLKILLKDGSVLNFIDDRVEDKIKCSDPSLHYSQSTGNCGVTDVYKCWYEKQKGWLSGYDYKSSQLASIPTNKIIYILCDEAIDANMPGLVPSTKRSKR